MSETAGNTALAGRNNALVMHDYILALTDDAKIHDLKALIGESISVKRETWEWGKSVVDLDRVVVTEIKAHIDLSSDRLSSVMIYCDFYLNGKLKYNAWFALDSLKECVKNYLSA
jgi:hypothetical protein